MSWTDLSGAFGYGTKLTSAQQQNLRDNVIAVHKYQNIYRWDNNLWQITSRQGGAWSTIEYFNLVIPERKTTLSMTCWMKTMNTPRARFIVESTYVTDPCSGGSLGATWQLFKSGNLDISGFNVGSSHICAIETFNDTSAFSFRAIDIFISS